MTASEVAAPPAAGAATTAAGEEAFVFPLSLAQERLWFVDQMSPGLAAYNIPLAVRLCGRLDRAALAAALAGVVRRHETLRTRFGVDDGQPVQVIAPETAAAPAAAAGAAVLPEVDLRALGAAKAAAEAARLAAAAAAAPFDLPRGPVWRARLLRTAAAEHVLLLVLHHIAGDRWSLGVLLAEVAALYVGRPLPPLPLQYADFAVWQREALAGGELGRQLAHWRERLAGAAPLVLPADWRRPARARHRGAVVRGDLPPALADALRQRGREAGATLFMTLLAGFVVVLAQHAGEDDLVVGTAVAGRARRELEGLIGFFVNTLPLRVDLAGEPTFGELVARVRAVALDAFAHQDVPFDRLVEEMRPSGGLGGGGAAPPLVQVTFLLQNTPLPELRLPGVELAEMSLPSRFAKFDLAVSAVEEAGGGVSVHWELDADLFLPAGVERLARQFRTLLAAAVAAPHLAVWDLPLADQAETAALLAAWNRDLRLPVGVAPPLSAPSAPSAVSETEELASWLCTAAATAAGVAAARVAPDMPWSRLALDSLAAVELRHEIAAHTGVEVELADLLDAASADHLAAAILARQQEERSGAAPSTAAMAGVAAVATAAWPEPSPPGSELPLAAGQRALWLIHQLAPASGAYHIAAAFRVLAPLDDAALRRAVATIARRHAALRSTFHARGGEPYQTIQPEMPPEWREIDATGLALAGLGERLADEAWRPFDLARGPLVRLVWLRGAAGGDRLLFVVHHLVADFTSLAVAAAELGALYGLAAPPPPPPPPPAVSYEQFVRWQAAALAGERLERLWAFWSAALAGAPAALDLPADRPRPPAPSYRGGVERARLPGGAGSLALLAGAGAGAGAGERAATPFVALAAAWMGLLHRTTGDEDLLVGTATAGRPGPRAAAVVGYFANPVVLRARPRGDQPFSALLAELRETTLAAFAHQDLPFPLLAERLHPERDAARSPVFQVSLALYREPGGAAAPAALAAISGIAGIAAGAPDVPLDLGGLRLASLALDERWAPFDLSLRAAEVAGDLVLALQFSRDLFDAVTARRLLDHLVRLLAAAAARPACRLAELPLLAAAERWQLLGEWAETATATARAVGLPHLVAEQAARTPDAVAVVATAGRHLSYGELDRRAAGLARRLAAHGVGLDSRVGLHGERSPELVIGALGILRTGAAFVPLDPELPPARLAFQLGDAVGAGGVVLAADAPAGPPWDAMRVLPLALRADGSAGAPGAGEVPPDGLAYVLYTSGSTGTPKGVMNSHRGIVNRLLWGKTVFPLTAADRVAQKTPATFDVAVVELFSPLVQGACLVQARAGGHREPAYLARWLVEQAITVAHFVPSLVLELLAERALPRAGALRRLLVGGEAMARQLALGVEQRLAARLYNLYGPAEAAVDTVTWPCRDQAAARPVPLGWPVANTRAYVVEHGGEPAPLGIAGELWLGGPQLGRGYLGRPALTAERFVPDPWAAAAGTAGARAYRTGDRVRRRWDGALEFLGRLDFQVKVRGVRIELGEIEAALVAQPEIAAAAVRLAGEAATARLVAFVVAARGASVPAAAELRRRLRQTLPDAMLPARCVTLAALPLTPHGKRDHAALALLAAAPAARPAGDAGDGGDAGEGGEGAAWEAPRGAVEELLAALYAELLPDLAPGEIGRDANFFALGGHSLLAARLAARAGQALGCELPLAAVWSAATLADLARAAAALRAAGVAELAPLVPVPREGELPLSFAQERLWFIDRLEPATAHYNLAAALAVHGALDRRALARAVAALAVRHEVLRARFPAPLGRPVQAIAATPAAAPLPLVDLAALPPAARAAELDRRMRDEARRPFDLARGPLLRCLLLHAAPGEHRLLVTLHHIVADGWSVGILERELGDLYAAGAGSRTPPLPVLPLQYADFAVWQRRSLTDAVAAGEAAWWRERLAAAPADLALPFDRPRPAVPRRYGASVPVALPPAVAATVGEWARRQRLTPFMALLAALQALLARYSGQPAIAVGAPVAGRQRAELEPLVGCFVNTLVLVGEVDDDPPFADLLTRTRQAVLAALAHQELPFERLVELLAPERRVGRQPFFQVLLAVEDARPAGLTLAGLRVARLPPAHVTAKADLALTVAGDTAGFRGALDYDRELFDPPTAARLAAHWTTLIAAAAAHPGRRLSELPLLSPGERAQVVGEWNDTAPAAADAAHAANAANPADSAAWLPVPAQVAARARRAPDAAALVQAGRVVSYGALYAAASSLAARLRACGVGPETTVALCAERSAELAVGLLAVLLAGGAFVPLDPAQPAARLGRLLSDARPRAVLTRRGLRDRLPPACDAPVIELDAVLAPQDVARPDAPPAPLAPADAEPAATPAAAPLAAPGQLAYVIYTSGSTGQPKGVEVSHAAFANLVAWHRRAWALAAGTQASWLSGVGFDASVWELWPALAAGGTLHLPDDATRLAPEALRDWLVARQVGIAFAPTALAAALVESPWPRATALAVLLTGGDRLAARPPAGLPFALINNYGPTEGTVVATAGCVPPRAAAAPAPPTIGRPISGVAVRLLDPALRPVPIGVAGELCIAGLGLARGYRGRPELTAERFVPDPLGGAGARLYRSGDLGRWLAAGEIEFLGRRDQQIKLRGHRIEPAEIEAVLAGHPAVRQAVVLAVGEGGARRLVASVEGVQGAASAADLRAHLRAALPEAMVPARLVFVERLPLTVNGKLDRRAVAAAHAAALAVTGGGGGGADQAAAAGADGTGGAPRGPVEELLAGVWADLLGIEAAAIGRQADFFALGGHSLLATRLAALVERAIGVEMPLAAVFAAPTLAGLAARIAAAHDATLPPLPPLPALPPLIAAGRGGPREEGGELAAAFAQERMWLLDRLAPASGAYHIATALAAAGALDVAALRGALDAFAGRHETLRTTFAERDGRLLQVIAPPSAQALPVIDLTAAPAGAAAELHRLVRAEAARPFDLARGPLLRVTLVRRGTRDQVLLVTLHHIIADAASVAVMLRELGVLYDAAQARGADHGGVVPVLAPLPIQYADYALWQRGWLRGELLAGEVAWWRERLAGLPPELPLPWDRPRPAVPRRAAHLARRPLAAAAALAALARAHGATLFMTLLAAFQVLLARLGGGDDVPVGTPVANRTRPEVEGLVGLFVNTLVLRGDLAAAPAFDAFLARTRDAALAAYAHQEVPIEKLVEALAPVRDAGRQPLFQVLFTLEEAPLAGLRLGGVALAPLAAAPAPAKFDLTLAVTRQRGELTATLELDGDRFDAATGELLADCFATLVAGIAGIAGIAAAPAPGVDALPLLDTAARRAVLAAAEGERVRRPARGLHELFEAQAARTPDAVALVDEDRHLTYQALDEWGNLLAHRLARVGVGADARVGICAERSAAMSAALLAVLKAGGAFVPLDPDHPPERLAGEIAESEARVVLVTAAVAARLPRLPAGTAVLRIAAPPPSPASERSPLPRRAALPAALAYVIFTSGSTGRPKGVMVSHGAILNHELFVAERYPLHAGDTALQITPFSFDAALWELFTPLAAGARLVVARPGGHRDPSYITRLAAAEGATVLQLVPSMAAPLLDDPGIAACRALRLVACGGEPLPGELADRLMARLGVALVNFYGPTECAIDATSWPCRPGEGRRRVVPIGLALPNVRAHVLDDGLAPLPVGAPGELCVGGACLARGYVGRPELTAERFVPDPWSAQPGERLYRTGDRVRRLRGGEIEYLGRRDAQVKVRGARVELGEIEAVLLAMPGVSEAAVVMAGDQDARRLVACVVPAAGAAGGGGGGGGGRPGELAAALRRHCREQLPEYMLPQAFVVLARLPRLPSGKLDRRAAAAAAAAAVADESAAAADGAPLTPYEEIVAGLWAEVLGRQRVGVQADFFADLGGHSLLAAQVVSRMRERLGVEIPLRALFDAPTVRGLAAVALGASEPAATAAIAVPLLARRAGEEPAALSFAQERIWFLTQLTPGLTAYNMPLALTLHGDLAVPALARALAALTARHEVLRTRYAALGGPPVQVVAPAAPVPLPVVDLGGLAGVAGGAAAEAARLAAAEARRAFDLGRDLPLRACLLRLGSGEHRLLLTLHHIAADGWSLGLVAGELGPLYAGEALAALPLQYADYAAWQRRAMSGTALARQLDYWRRQLAELPPLELPADRPRPAVPRHRGAVLPWRLPVELGDRLRQLAREAAATLFMTLLAGFQELLARHAGQDDFAVGTAVANRGRREIEGLVGLFVNTLALRTAAGGDGAAGFAARVAATRETTLAAYAHQDVPFERLVEELQPARDTRRAPLVQVMLLWQNTPLPALALTGLAASAAAVDNGSAKLDLLLSLEDEAGAVAGAWEVDTDLFDVATIARFADRFRCLLAAAAAEPRRPLAALRWFDEAERREVLAAGQAAPAAWQAERPVRALVAAQAARTPEAVAVTAAGERALSYGALDAAAARLAGALRRRGVGPEVRVGVCLDRGPELLVALLAVLEAGGAYVPLDPAHPPARLAAAIADAAPRLVLAARRHRALLAGAAIYDIEEALAAPGGAPLSTAAAGAAPADRCLDGAAYVIFTSGSTGRPKGVVVTHRGLSNLLLAIRDLGAVVPGEALLAVTTLGFDIAGLELFVPLVTGGTVALAAREESAEPARLRARLADPRIAAMQATPATWHMLLDDGWRPRRGFHVLCGGEALPAALAAALLAPGAALWNLYGPTETTIWSTALRVAPHVPRGAIVPLGAPLAHTTLRVLDGGGEPVPLGVAGELHIGGAGVARGYLDRPDLTAERFVPDAWGAAGARLYRTGDRVCRRSSGALEFLGRLDHQVKLRGFRIEPAEIAAVLRDSPGIGEAVVVLREDVPGGPRLVAYVVPAAPAGAGEVPAAPADTAAADLAAALRRRCRERLPAQMVPAAFVVLPRLPLTPNGKLDRRALPAPAAPASPAAGERGSAAAVAATPLEEIVAGLWADVLGRERVGIEDDFFTDLGGHSLLATQVVARLRERLGYELPLRSLFEAPTVRAWAGRVAAAAEVGEDAALAAAPPRLERRPKAAPGEPPAPLPLSFAQERLWFLEQLAPGLPVYNLPLAVRLSGPLDRAALARALAAVVARHEALRTRFRFAGGRPVQEVAPALAIDLPGAPLLALPLVDLTGVAAPAGATASATAPGTAAALSMPASTVAARLAAAEAARPFDLEMAPLLRATLVALAAGEHLLLLTLHHIAGDGWSFGVLLRELGALYAGRVLPELPVQYADYALWQRRWLRGAVLDGQLAFWRRQLADLPVLDLAADRPRPPAQAHRGGQVPIAAPAALLPALRQCGRAAGATLFMTLLAGFQALLARWSGQRDLAVGTAVANRRRRELEGLIGFFANTLVLRADLAAATDFAALLAQVRATTLDAYAHQDVPFEKLVEQLRPTRDIGRNPLVQVMLVLQNAPLAVPPLPGLTAAAAAVAGHGAMFDLSLLLTEDVDGGLRGVLEYDADLWDAATAERLADHFLRLLAAAAAATEGATAPLADLPLLSPGELRQVVEEWNRTAREPRPAATLHARVAAQARRTPAAVAVVHGGRRLTYGELADAAGVLAGRLRRAGAGAGRIVAVSLERSAEMVVALLGVLAAGAAYVPLDPAYPAERRAWVLGDAGAALGVTSTRLQAQVAGDSAVVRWLCVDQPEEEEAVAGPGGAAAVASAALAAAMASAASGWRETDPSELAYVIYTSGSTGRPKGVAIAHESASALLDWSAATFPDAALAGVLASTSISFDLSIFELFGTLARGGTVVLAETLFDEAAWDCGWPVTLVNTVPSLLDSLLAGRPLPASVQVVNLAGEALPARLVERLRAALPDAVVMNLYGPSEATTYSTWARVGGEPVPPIGRPVAGTWGYVLDGAMAPQPVGVPGELYLGGAGLARGYLGRPELTAEKFLPDPFGDQRGKTGWGGQGSRGGERLYRTGDRVRWLRGGVLEYLGRLDDQVKLRGFRIEPGEVEAALAGHPAVREAAVVVREDAAGERRLVAYVALAEAGARAAAAGAAGNGNAAGASAGDAAAAELRRYCRERLPAHLVPAAFVMLPRLPLTASGKLDRRALPAPEAPEAALAGQFVAPRNELERTVAAIWQEVLGVERVGTRDNFFDLGGHSLLLVSLRDRLRQRLGRDFTLVDLFRHPTVAAFADALAQPVAAAELPRDAIATRAAQREAAMRDRRSFRPGSKGGR